MQVVAPVSGTSRCVASHIGFARTDGSRPLITVVSYTEVGRFRAEIRENRIATICDTKALEGGKPPSYIVCTRFVSPPFAGLAVRFQRTSPLNLGHLVHQREVVFFWLFGSERRRYRQRLVGKRRDHIPQQHRHCRHPAAGRVVGDIEI